jgi:CRISPR-associated protein Cmr4
MKTSLLFLYTESALHVGAGKSLSAVDLPIQRERTTEFPNVQGSGLKGALRSQTSGDQNTLFAVFGPDTDKASDYAGALSVGEAHLVLFPVRSLKGVFAYATSALALARLAREAAAAGYAAPIVNPAAPASNQCFVTSSTDINAGGSVVLEEFAFNASVTPEATQAADWLAQYAFPPGPEYDYWRAKLKGSFVILPEDAFRDFVVHSTEVTTRVRLEPDSKTVAQGALWTQESLPADSLLVSAVTARRARNGADWSAEDMMTWVQQNIPARVQVGGDESTGQGAVALRWL